MERKRDILTEESIFPNKGSSSDTDKSSFHLNTLKLFSTFEGVRQHSGFERAEGKRNKNLSIY